MAWFDRQFNQDIDNGDMLLETLIRIADSLEAIAKFSDPNYYPDEDDYDRFTTKHCQKEEKE